MTLFLLSSPSLPLCLSSYLRISDFFSSPLHESSFPQPPTHKQMTYFFSFPLSCLPPPSFTLPLPFLSLSSVRRNTKAQKSYGIMITLLIFLRGGNTTRQAAKTRGRRRREWRKKKAQKRRKWKGEWRRYKEKRENTTRIEREVKERRQTGANYQMSSLQDTHLSCCWSFQRVSLRSCWNTYITLLLYHEPPKQV